MKYLSKNNPLDSKFVFRPVSEDHIRMIVKSLKKKDSTGIDRISMRIIANALDVLIVPLTYIVNKSLITGKYPSAWKKSLVIPIHKKGSVRDVANYRPVSLLCVVSKVLENVALLQMTKYCNEKEIIPNSQFGFRKNRCTMAAIAAMYYDWLQKVEEISLWVLYFLTCLPHLIVWIVASC